MITTNRNSLRYLMSRRARAVPNEVLIRTMQSAQNDDLPHYLNVAAAAATPQANYGDAASGRSSRASHCAPAG
jgi:hypothetical protein